VLQSRGIECRERSVAFADNSFTGSMLQFGATQCGNIHWPWHPRTCAPSPGTASAAIGPWTEMSTIDPSIHRSIDPSIHRSIHHVRHLQGPLIGSELIGRGTHTRLLYLLAVGSHPHAHRRGVVERLHEWMSMHALLLSQRGCLSLATLKGCPSIMST
jgi:hypothetical protein